MDQELIQVGKSGISGKGVFATSLIKKGERICFMKGELINLDEMIARVDNDLEEGSDPLGVDDEMYIDMEGLYRCMNHSCNPNAFLRGRNELVALRDIEKGEEIFYDYSTTMNDNLPREVQWTMKCKCGSLNCRKKVDQFKTLPLERQKYYTENRLAPDFILRKFTKNSL